MCSVYRKQRDISYNPIRFLQVITRLIQNFNDPSEGGFILIPDAPADRTSGGNRIKKKTLITYEIKQNSERCRAASQRYKRKSKWAGTYG